MAYERKDFWYRKAKQQGYRSRAAYKLIELDRRLKLFHPGCRVVDLGCAPGGWLQVASERVGTRGCVVGMDRLDVEPLGRQTVHVLKGDVTDEQSTDRLLELLRGRADVVLSDMAPDTSGVGFADHVRSVELAETSFEIAAKVGRKGCWWVAKVFDGQSVGELCQKLRNAGCSVRRLRLSSTRKGSRELYLAGRLERVSEGA
ncbi:MAG: RlmE family RNA methyltransferase [Deltaproteobacteria bacterium]|nr:MAG: RlmE family RNA methyltransferase [Deltaproteobacteria bacterium]